MASARWRKLAGDLRTMRGRVVLMVLALAVSTTGFGVVLGARTVLRREIAASYLASQPADATLELAEDLTPQLLARVRARADLADVDAREVVMARVTTSAVSPAMRTHMATMGYVEPDDARALQLFVVDDFAAMRLDVFTPESGAWPPPPGTMLVERTAIPMLGRGLVTVTTRHGSPHQLAIAGVVHDAGLAPAWQEAKGYGYITRATLALLGEPGALHELRVRFRPEPTTGAEAEVAAEALAKALVADGHPVRQIRVPGFRVHPHAAQMAVAQTALLVFSVLLLVLCAILVVTILAAMLARQVREIGVMKTIGASTAQLVRLYATAVVAIAGVAFVIALPLAWLGAHAMIDAIGVQMNLAIADPEIPPWVFAVQALAAVGLPLGFALLPIRRACRLTVRAALAQHGTRGELIRPALVRLPMAARNALRRPARLALMLGLLTAGGTMATTAINIKRAYEANIERMPRMWHHDLEVRTPEPVPVELAATLAALPGVTIVEPWGDVLAAFVRPGQIELVHTYPDHAHGSFPIHGFPPDTRLASLPLVSGRWLRADDTDAIVVDRSAHAPLGSRLDLSLDGITSAWMVVGVVDAVPANGGYVTAESLGRATHTEGKARTFRVAGSVSAAMIVAELARHGIAVEATLTTATLRGAMDAHVLVIVRASIMLAAIIALIGLFGLGVVTSVNVVERTRELGILKAVGATGGRIMKLVIGEAALIGLASWLLTVIFELPLTALIDRLLDAQGFLSARFIVSPAAIVGWLAVSVLGGAAAAILPARRAARLTVREALAEA